MAFQLSIFLLQPFYFCLGFVKFDGDVFDCIVLITSLRVGLIGLAVDLRLRLLQLYLQLSDLLIFEFQKGVQVTLETVGLSDILIFLRVVLKCQLVVPPIFCCGFLL